MMHQSVINRAVTKWRIQNNRPYNIVIQQQQNKLHMKTYTQVLGWVNKIKENAKKIEGLTAAEAVSFRNDLAKARDKANGCKDGWQACRSSKNAEVISLCNVYFNFNMARSRKLTKVDAPKPPKKKTATKKWNAAITAWDDLSDSQRTDFLIEVGAIKKASK